MVTGSEHAESEGSSVLDGMWSGASEIGPDVSSDVALTLTVLLCAVGLCANRKKASMVAL